MHFKFEPVFLHTISAQGNRISWYVRDYRKKQYWI